MSGREKIYFTVQRDSTLTPFSLGCCLRTFFLNLFLKKECMEKKLAVFVFFVGQLISSYHS